MTADQPDQPEDTSEDEPIIGRTRKRKWSHQFRAIMYARITMEFGPYARWGHSRHPKGQEPRYEAVLKELAAFFSSISGEDFEWTALRQQIEWACRDPKTVIKFTHAQSFILNKAAALEMGFIRNSDLPKEMLISC